LKETERIENNILPSFFVIDSSNSKIATFSADTNGRIIEREDFLAGSVTETTLISVVPS